MCGQVLSRRDPFGKKGQWAARRGAKMECCGQKYKPKDILHEGPPRPYGNHTAQLNLYRLLLERNGREVRSMAIVYLDMKGILCVPVSLWPLDRVEGLIRERLRPLAPYYGNGSAPETLPVGVQDDKTRKWECGYCAVGEQCRTMSQADDAPF
jgi:CRISPR/Cas system-associated exonuclease Cas4 (RecB family)